MQQGLSSSERKSKPIKDTGKDDCIYARLIIEKKIVKQKIKGIVFNTGFY